MSESNKRNFIVHGSILAIAGILVRIIGMLYRIPVVKAMVYMELLSTYII